MLDGGELGDQRRLYYRELALNGTLKYDATAKLYLTFGLDTAGFYLLSGKTVEGVIDASGELTGTLAADRRSLTGTFAGGSCSGTWNGARQ